MKAQQQKIAVIDMAFFYLDASGLQELWEENEWLGCPAI